MTVSSVITDYLYQIQLYILINKQMSIPHGAIRPKIFEKWPKQSKYSQRYESDFESKKHHASKDHQSLRAEQILQKSLFFIQNIERFIQEYNKSRDEVEKFNEVRARSEQNLEKLCQSGESIFDQKQYIKQLRTFFVNIREGGKVLRKLRLLGLANLQNYDQKTTKMHCTRSSEQAIKILDENLRDLKRKRSKVQQTLVKYEYSIPESLILEEENSFQRCLENLIEAMSTEKIEQFHFLMLYRLKLLQQLTEQMQRILRETNESYSRYEGINDSFNLMKVEIKFMENDKQSLQRKFTDLKLNNANDKILTKKSEQVLDNNLKIYESNLNLFAKYNSETNLKQFSNLRNKYTTSYYDFRRSVEKFKESNRIAEYLYERQQKINEYEKKLGISQKRESIADWELKSMEQAYIQLIKLKIPSKSEQIENYRLDLIREYQKIFRQNRIAFPKRDPQYEREYLNKFAPYSSFFIRIGKIPEREKTAFLLANKEEFQTLHYSFEQEKTNKEGKVRSEESQKYEYGFKYVENILEYLLSGNPDKGHQDYLRKVERYSTERWQALPIGVDDLIFRFTRDVMIKKQAYEYLFEKESVFEKGFDKFLEQLSDYVKQRRRFPQQNNLAFSFLEEGMNTAFRRKFFMDYVFQISKIGVFIRDELIDKYFSLFQQKVESCFLQISDLIKFDVKTDKKKFFTFETLCYLTQQDRKLKIPNITDSIKFYLGFADRHEKDTWRPQKYFSEIVKQRILLNYLKNFLSKYSDVKNEILSIQKVHKFCFLRYVVNDHLQLADQDDIFQHFQYSLALEDELENADSGYDRITDSSLSAKTASTCSSLKKNPVVFGQWHKLSEYEQLMKFYAVLARLKKPEQSYPKDQMQFLSGIYDDYSHLKNALEITKSCNYESSAIVAVAENPKQMVYIQKILDDIKQECNQKVLQALKKISNNFRGEDDDDLKVLLRDAFSDSRKGLK